MGSTPNPNISGGGTPAPPSTDPPSRSSMDTDETENTATPKGYLLTGGDLDNQIGSSIALNLSGQDEDTADDISNVVASLRLMKQFFDLSPSHVEISDKDMQNISTALSRTIAIAIDRGFLDPTTPNGKNSLDIIQSLLATYVPHSKTTGASYRKGVHPSRPSVGRPTPVWPQATFLAERQ